VQQPPERPFVPRRTPTKAQPAIGSADFTVVRPFVPGADRERMEALRLEYASDTRSARAASLPPIEEFLDLAVGAASAPVAANSESLEEPLVEEDELPPVEHFIDPLPAVEDFAAADIPAPDWGETDWQQYDWRAAAALGESSSESEATTAWATTDWDSETPRPRETKPTAAQAIATALDQIAQRIRNGELALPSPGTAADPSAMAATLAALLGIKR
jgi:hypothetical protein